MIDLVRFGDAPDNTPSRHPNWKNSGRGGKLGFSLTQDTTDVIYAEDEEVFRETAVRELLKLGFLRQDFSCSREGEVGHIFGP